VSVERGHDPRDFALVAFGGAGPLHAAALARDLGVARVLVPAAPGILCALGLLVEPLRLDLVRTRVDALDGLDAAGLTAAFAELEGQAHAWLDREGVPPERWRLTRALDMRYVGQNFELLVPAPAALEPDALRRAFLAEHACVYGHSADDDAIQVVSYRLTALGEPGALTLPPRPAASDPSPKAARVGERPVYFDETGDFVTTPVYRRERLQAGHRLEGPAIVEQMDSTTVLLPGQWAAVDAQGNLLIHT
jgi:N-methylhydantoinase A